MPVRLAVARTTGLGERCLPGFASLKTYPQKASEQKKKRRGADAKCTKKV